jgi:hypothetical protein
VPGGGGVGGGFEICIFIVAGQGLGQGRRLQGLSTGLLFHRDLQNKSEIS